MPFKITGIETVIGLSRINFDMIRIDGSETLLGDRRANQLFLSNTLKRDYKKNQLEISPYLIHSATLTRLDAFSETNGSLALTFNNQQFHYIQPFKRLLTQGMDCHETYKKEKK